MSQSQSTHPVRPGEPSGDADREARIEQLLLSGLDHYFAGQYERAISVWTRVVFLERHHDRARAYIERARSALAERHRESEEFLHAGVAAYHSGDVEQARDLLTRAAERGSDSADVFLDRLHRVGPSSSAGPGLDLRLDPVPVPSTSGTHVAASRPHRRGGVAAVLLAGAVAVAMLVGGLPIGTWLFDRQPAVPAMAVPSADDEPLPVVRASEVDLARARALRADGRLFEALRVLDRVGLSDPYRPDADRLRADIQRDLLTVAGLDPLAPVQTGGRP